MGALDTEQPTQLIDYPRQLLEHIEASLRYVGLEVPALIAQIVLFVLAAVLLAVIVWRIRRAPLEHAVHLVGGAGIALIMLAIIMSWVTELIWPIPDVLRGKLQVTGLRPEVRAELRVDLLDVRRREISVEGGWVDSVTGRFSVAYEKRFGDRPYYVRISTAGCKELEKPLSLSRLRSGSEFSISFKCESES